MKPRQLPERPAFAVPVMTPAPRAGEFCTVVIKRERQAKSLANARITSFGEWYENVRKEFAQ